MKVWQNIKNFVKRYGGASALAGFIGLGVYGSYVQAENHKKQKEKAQIEQRRQDSVRIAETSVKSPVLNVAYHTDTLEHAQSTLLLYCLGKITRYYVENNNSFRMQLPYFAHEEWHHHNDELKFRSKNIYTPAEYYKLCMHDEISANLTALLTARYEYLSAPTRAEKQKIINRYKNTYMKFYFDEIAKGRIKPGSKKVADIEKERKLLANGTMKMWMNTYSRSYTPSIYRMLQRYIIRAGLVADGKNGYQKVLNQMYTIGGVNFANYFEHDIEMKEDKVLIAEQLPKIRFMKAGGVEIMNIVNQNYPLLQEVGVEKQTEIFQNLLISSQLKYLLRNKTAEELQENPQLINLCFRKVLNSAYNDPSFQKVVENFPIINEHRGNLLLKDYNFDETTRKMYMFKGVDLTAAITDFSPKKVPVKSVFEQGFEKNYYNDIWAEFFLYPKIKVQLQKSTLQPPKNNNSSVLPPSQYARPRRSGVMHVNIPNFREPILLNNTPEVNDIIFASLREFEAIPQVFKNCDTLAQQKYLREHREYLDSLKNFQATGSVNIKQFVKNKARQK